jgi:hypothetical protein
MEKPMSYRHTTQPELVFRGEQVVAVILDIEEYRKMLEYLEDAEDLNYLAAARKQNPTFKRLDDCLAEQMPHV